MRGAAGVAGQYRGGTGGLAHACNAAGPGVTTQALVATELETAADHRRGALLAVVGAGLGWISWLTLWSLYRAVTGEWPRPWAWPAVSVAMAVVTAPLAAALHRARTG